MTKEILKTDSNKSAAKTVNAQNNRRLSSTNRLQLRSRMRNLLMFLPNLIKLCFRLLRDQRVSTADKALFAGAIIYAVVPLDLIPDVLPFVGQIDDVYLIALTLLRLVNRSDEKVLRELWTGGGDVVQLARSIAGIAPMLLPQRVNRVLTERVEIKTEKIAQAVKEITKKTT